MSHRLTDEEYMGSAVRLPVTLHDRLRRLAFETRISKNTLMVALLEMSLDTVDTFDPNALTLKQRDELSLLSERDAESRKQLIFHRLTFFPGDKVTPNGGKARV